MNRVKTSVVGIADGGVSRVRVLLDEFALANRLPPGPVSDMQVALDEILSNTLRSGFSDGLPHRVDVSLSVDSLTLTAEIVDDCAPFDPFSVPTPDVRARLQDRRVGGLGIHFVRTLMSEVTYARADGRNRLVLSRNLVDSVEGERDGSE